MRRISHKSFRERGLERRRPPPRWYGIAHRLGVFALVALTIGGATKLAIDHEIPHHTRLALVQALDAGSRKLGLTVEEAFAEGRTRTSPEAVAAALQGFVGGSTLFTSVDEVRARLEALPWVRRATVRKQFPGSLFVTLEEHEAIALWHDGNRVQLVGADGSLLLVEDLRSFAGLKLLQGAGAPEAAKPLLDLLAQSPDLARHVTAASRVGGRRWNLYIDGHIEVRLPERDTAEAIERLARMAQEGDLFARAIVAVDLRSQAWTAIRLKGEAADILIGRGA
jgi:cell division protein FtsQ